MSDEVLTSCRFCVFRKCNGHLSRPCDCPTCNLLVMVWGNGNGWEAEGNIELFKFMEEGRQHIMNIIFAVPNPRTTGVSA